MAHRMVALEQIRFALVITLSRILALIEHFVRLSQISSLFLSKYSFHVSNIETYISQRAYFVEYFRPHIYLYVL